MGWPSVAYHFQVAVTLTLTSDLVFIVITMSVRPPVRPSVPLRVRCISPIFFEVKIPKFDVWMHLGMTECHVPFSGHCDLDLDL